MSERQDTPDSAPDTPPQPLEATSTDRRSFTTGLHQFLTARTELLGLEAKEASFIFARKAILVIMAAGAAILTYLLLLVMAAWIINHFLSENLAHWSIPATALILALLHLGAALLFGRKAKEQNGPPLFEFTRSEWQKDRAWLSKKTSKNENES